MKNKKLLFLEPQEKKTRNYLHQSKAWLKDFENAFCLNYGDHFEDNNLSLYLF